MEENQSDEDFDWSVYEEKEQKTIHLEAKDYIALFIAALQTIFLPLIVVMIFLVVIAIAFAVII